MTLQTKILALILAAVTGFSLGWNIHAWKVADDSVKATVKSQEVADEIVEKVDEIKVEANKKLTETKIVYRTIKEKIREKDDNRICFADADALSLWNMSIAGTDPHRRESATKPGEIDTSRNQNTTVDQVLRNGAENFETCNNNAIKHQALIDAVRAHKGNMCVCAPN